MPFQELFQKVLEIKRRADEEKRPLTPGEIQQIRAYRNIFCYLKGVLEKETLSTLISENQREIKDYTDYLDGEIQKYRKQFEELVQASDENHNNKKQAKKIALARGKLEKAMNDRENFEFNYQEYIASKLGRQLKNYLDNAQIALFNHELLHYTSFINDENAFLISAVPPVLNDPNVKLALEVLKARKTDNLKRLMRLEEIEHALLGLDIQEASKEGTYEHQVYQQYKKEIDDLKKEIPEPLQHADIHALNRLNYFGKTGLQKYEHSKPVFGSFIPASAIDDDFTIELNPIGEEAINSLQLAEDIEQLKGYSLSQIHALFGLEEKNKEKDVLQGELHHIMGAH